MCILAFVDSWSCGHPVLLEDDAPRWFNPEYPCGMVNGMCEDVDPMAMSSLPSTFDGLNHQYCGEFS